MKTITTIAIASTFVSGIAFAEVHPTDETFEIFDNGMSSGQDMARYGYNPSDEGQPLLDRYSMYGFSAHDHEHGTVRISRMNPDSTILADQAQF